MPGLAGRARRRVEPDAGETLFKLGGNHRTKIERLIDAGVIYRRRVDDIPVDGPGGYVMVNIDPGGEVIGLRSVLAPHGCA